MKFRVMAVYDRVAQVFANPNYQANLGGAIRAFGDALRDPQSNLSKHPDDFDFYELGTFDDETAKFELHERPQQVALGKEMKVEGNLGPNGALVKAREKDSRRMTDGGLS